MPHSQKARLLASKQGFASIAVIVAIVVVVGAAAYFLMMRQSGAPSGSTPTPVPTPTPVTTTPPTPATTNETAEWKTYRNEKYGFELKFTDIWKDYRAIEKADPYSSGIHFITFEVPSDQSRGQYVGVTSIEIYTPKEWSIHLREENPSGTPHPSAQNNRYIFYYGGVLGGNHGIEKTDVDAVLSSFQSFDIQ